MYFEGTNVRLAANADFFRLHGVVPDLNPTFFLGLQISQEIRGTLPVWRENALEQARQILGAEILPVPLSVGVEIISGGTARHPFYLLRGFVEKAVGDSAHRVRHRKN